MSRALNHISSTLWAFLITLLAAVATGAVALWGHWPGIVALGAASAVALAGSVLVAVRTWRSARAVQVAADALARSAQRIGQGDYARPVEARGHEALTELEQAMERMRGRLRQSTINRDYLRSILDSMTDAVFLTSPDGVVKTANAAACKMLGYAEEELLGRGIVSLLDPSVRAEFDLLQAAQDTRETVVRTRDGQTIPVSLAGSRVETDDPQFQGNIFVARNVTDRKRAERRIRYLARYDTLTKVANRMQFQHLLQQTLARGLRSGRAVALLYLDMDRFKEVNDTF